MKQVGIILLLSASCVFGAVPSTTDFNTNYFTSGTLPVSVVGNLTNWSKLATNVISTNPGAGMSGTVSNNIASAGLLSVDATKTNGIAAIAAHIVSTLGFTPANSNNIPAAIWTNLPTLTDMEGGTVYGATLKSANANGGIQVQVNTFTNFPFSGGSTGVVFSAGFPVPSTSLATNNNELFLIGDFMAEGLSANNSYNVFSFGYATFRDASLDHSFQLYAIGESGFNNSAATNSDDIYLFGDASGSGNQYNYAVDIYAIGQGVLTSSVITNTYHIFAYGNQILGHSTFKDSFDMMFYGDQAFDWNTYDNCNDVYGFGQGVNEGNIFNPVGFTNKSHMFAIGSGSRTTNSNDFVVGDSAYNYFFPGASTRFDNTVTFSSDATVPIISFGTARQYQDTLTHAGTVTLDFSTTNSHSLSITGNVTLAFSNVQTNRLVNLLIKGCSTNSTVTWPSGVHGQPPTISESNRWVRCWLEAWGTGNTNVIVSQLADL